MRSTILLLLAFYLDLSGCASTGGEMLPGAIYSQNGKMLQFQIQRARRSGAVIALDPATGEHFTGQYTGIIEGVSGGSNTFAIAGNATAQGFSNTSFSSNVADANAIFTGDKGTTLTCTMKIEAGWRPHGIGHCQDNKNVNYQLQF